MVLVKGFMRLYSKYQLWLQAPERSGGAGGSTSKISHLHSSSQEALISYRVDLCTGLPQCLHDLTTDFTRASDPGEGKEKERNRSAFYILVSEATHCHFSHVFSVRSESLDLAHIQGEEN